MKSFDERAKDWDADPAKVERARLLAAQMQTALPLRAGMTALEYGCGTGLLSFALIDSFAALTLTDTSQGMLDVLAEKIKRYGLKHLRPILIDLSQQNLPGAHFDVAYSLLTMHHIADTQAILQHLYALINPGGFLFIADLEKEDGSFHGAQVKDVHQGFERAALQKQVEAAGFNQVRFSPAFSIYKQVDGGEKAFAVFLMIAEKANA